MQSFLANFLNIEIFSLVWPQLLAGLVITLKLALAIVPLGVALGLLIASAHSFHRRGLNFFLVGYVDFFRAFPPLVLLVFVYYALPFVGIELKTFGAVVLALTINTSSFF